MSEDRPPQPPLDRAYFDLLAYGRHFETCTKGRVIVPKRKHRSPIREATCSCGYDRALDQLEEARRR